MTRTLSSVTRWLLVVVGCAVLETAQPTKAAETAEVDAPAAEALSAPAPSPTVNPAAPTAGASAPAATADERSGETLLIPGGSARGQIEPPPAAGPSSWLIVLGLCAGGSAWFWWRKRVRHPLVRASRERQIQIEETRPLGNRQYLVLATVGERKFLLGVTPGSIQLLSPLESREEVAREPVA